MFVTFSTIFCRLRALAMPRASLAADASGRPSAPVRSSRRPESGPSSEAGFTLIETLVASVVLIVGLIALLGLLDTSVKASASTRQREAATNLARQVLEDARGIPFGQISPSSIVGELQAMPGLKNEGSGSSWQVVRSGTTYTIAVNECSIDDGKGELWGVHKNAFGEDPFCRDPGEKEWKAGEKGPDPQPEDLKRITVDVTWTAKGRSPDVHQVETVTAADAAPGLNAINLHLESPFESTEPVIEAQPASGTLTFAVSSPPGTAAMRWSLEGTAQSPAPTLKSGTTWTFSWPIPDPGVSDGTYTVSVQAIDKTGVVGPPVSIGVTLIRNVPAVVTGLIGGLNTINVAGFPEEVVELQWQANAERNVIGYRVYRPNGKLACPEGGSAVLSVAATCIDKNPPKPASHEWTYSAVALYRNAKGVVEQGPPGTFTVNQGGPLAPPNPPTGLTLTHNEEGAVVLKWTPPSGGTPVAFYRIYRGSTNYTSRYDVAPAVPEPTYTDTDAAVAHSYWVTAVDKDLTESSFLGPVTG